MNDDLQTYIEPEMEARIVALVLGEASAFEAEELERLIAEKSELQAYRARLEEVHGLLGAAHAEVDDSEWKLSDERRGKVFSKIEEGRLESESQLAKQRKRQRARRQLVCLCAACLVMSMILLVQIQTYSKVQLSEPMMAVESEGKSDRYAYGVERSAGSKSAVQPQMSDSRESAKLSIGPPSSESRHAAISGALASLDDSMLESRVKEKSRSLALYAEEESAEQSENPFNANRNGRALGVSKGKRTSRELARKPSAPSSYKSDVIAANTASPGAIPVPASPIPSAGKDFGDGDDFGDGWGAERGGESRVDATGLGDAPGAGGRVSGGADHWSFELVESDKQAETQPGSGSIRGLKEKSESLSEEPALTHNTKAPPTEAAPIVTAGLRTESNNRDFIGSVDRAKIPGIPELPQEENEKSSPFPDPASRPLVKGLQTFGLVPSERLADFDGDGMDLADDFASFDDSAVVEGMAEEKKQAVQAKKKSQAGAAVDGVVPSLGKESKGKKSGEVDLAIIDDGLSVDHPDLSADFSQENNDLFMDVDESLSKREWKSSADGKDTKLDASPPKAWDRFGSEKEVEEVEVESRGRGGSRSDFGNGNEDGKDRVLGREILRRQASVAESDEKLLAGREAYAEGDYETAVERYREATALLPLGTATEERKNLLNQHLADGSVALTQKYRRTGKYKEARELLEEVKKNDPGNDAVQKELEYLDDPIRTEAALTYEHSKEVDQIRRNLYKGESFYNLGVYDKAEEEFKQVLRTDPYNKAARRWLERSAAIRSDYYRAAYDQTRATESTFKEKITEEELLKVLEDSKKELNRAKEGLQTAMLLPDRGLLNDEVDQIRRNLYKGESYYNLGIYDKAEEEFKQVLRTDPYNKAARRWLERNAAIKSDYYRAAYDQTRAEMLMKVDQAWELAVPQKQDGKMGTDQVGRGASKGREASFSTGRASLFGVDSPVVEFPEEFGKAGMDTNLSSFLLGDEQLTGDLLPSDEGIAMNDVGERSVISKGNQIIIPEVKLTNATVAEALDFVRARSIELDNTTLDDSMKGVNIVAGDGDVLKRRLPNLDLQNVALMTLLDTIADSSGINLSTDEFAFRLSKGEVPEVFEQSVYDGDQGVGNTKFDQIILPEIHLKNASIREAIEFLKLRSIELDEMTPDQDKKGLEIVIEEADLKEQILDQRQIAELKLKNVPLREVAKEIARMTGSKIRIEGGKVIFFANPARKTDKLPEGFETSTSEKSDSTFSLNVSDVSFKLAKAALAGGSWPDASKVRPEEFVNALDYDDTKPTQAEKIACEIEQGTHPFMQQRNLMRIAMSTASLGRNANTPLRLTILLDQSGSMERADRVESVKRAFALLAAQLNPNDEVTLVGFARTPRLLAERVKGDQVAKLATIIANPLSEGGTNLEEALSAGLLLAKQQYAEGGQNRIILLTDGAANLGDAKPENLARQVESMRRSSIAFDACGVGADGLNDDILSSLAKQGDGRYYFLDRPEDADEGFARQIAGALRPAAKNVKVQILFNPERVSTFKLYGFEKHKLKKEDFRNDSVDAAEMAAEESGVALYHFEPLPEGRGDIGTVSVRFLDTASNEMVERTWAIPYLPDAPLFSEAKPTLRLASLAGLFAEKLKASPVGDRVALKRLRQEAQLLKPTFQNQARFNEFQTMLQQAGE